MKAPAPRSPPDPRAPAPAFTLIELLVVVTIIAILIALVTPALDSAIYQAQLAVCAARQRVIGGGVMTYALDAQRSYPPRHALEDGYRRPILLYMGQYAGLYPDDRPALARLFALNATLNDPLTEAVDLANPDSQAEIYAPYALWFGWRYIVGQERGMLRLGDRFTWQGDAFDVLASDWDGFYAADQQINSHPDRDGVMFDAVFQDRDLYETPLTTGPTITTFSFWHSPGGVDRGVVDTNHAFDDGSVRRSNAVGIDEPERMIRVPQDGRRNNATWEAHLPRR